LCRPRHGEADEQRRRAEQDGFAHWESPFPPTDIRPVGRAT
jgi:hypothetical protein